MGGGSNNRPHKKSSFSLASLFTPRRPRRVEDVWAAEETMSGRKDEEKRYWPVPEPGIDRRASAFIANFHATRVSEALNYQAAERPDVR